MKRITALLLMAFAGFYLGLTGCEKSDAQPEACIAEITARLQLVDTPQLPCESYVMLYRVDDRYLYNIGSPICDYVPRWFDCTGLSVVSNVDDVEAINERAVPVRRVGFLPAYRACQEETATRLELTDTPAPTSCSTLVSVYHYLEQDYFALSSPVCRITAAPFDCDGEPVCDEGDRSCLDDFYRRAEYLRDLGYLPE